MKVVAILSIVSLLSLLLVGCSDVEEGTEIILKINNAPNNSDVIWIARNLCDRAYYPVITEWDNVPGIITLKCSNPQETIIIEYNSNVKELKVVKK
jgi:hypothetical protein